jgi:hypothetical protein
MASTFACWRSFTISVEGPLVGGAGCVVDVEAEGGEGADVEGAGGEAGGGVGEAGARVAACFDPEAAERTREAEDGARVVASFDEEAAAVDL